MRAIIDSVWWTIMAVLFVVFVIAFLYGGFNFIAGNNVEGVKGLFGVLCVGAALQAIKPGRWIW